MNPGRPLPLVFRQDSLTGWVTLSSGGQVQAQAGQQRLESPGGLGFHGIHHRCFLMFFEWFRMKKMDEHGVYTYIYISGWWFGNFGT